MVTRPAMPVPWICEMSTLCSLAILRTSGDERCVRVAALVDRRRRRGLRWRRARGGVDAGRRRRPRQRRGRRGGLRRRRLGCSAAARERRAGAAAALAGARAAGADHRDDAVDRNRLAFLDADLGDDAGGGRRNFGIHLVGRDLEQRLVAIDRVADLLDPADDRAFGDRLAHLRHHDVGWHMLRRLLDCRFARSSRIQGPDAPQLEVRIGNLTCVSPRRAWHAPPRRPLPPSSDARESCESALRPCDSSRSATVASATSSVERRPIMCTPSTSSYFLSATIFTNPSVSPAIFARPRTPNGNVPMRTS